MTQYIDKDAVIAEIGRRIEEITQTISLGNKKIQKSGGNRKAELVRFLSFLDTLEVKEVDLDEEADNHWGALSSDVRNSIYYNDYYKIAEHFFELGLKARKGG